MVRAQILKAKAVAKVVEVEILGALREEIDRAGRR